MKVLLVGCGAVGLSLASALYTAGADTHLIVRGETAKAIENNGITRRGILGDALIPPEHLHLFDSIENTPGCYDFVINSTKATANGDIAARLARRQNDILAPGGRFVICQNGYGNERSFTDTFRTEQIYHASFAIGFRRPEPHISEVTVITSPVSIGSIFGTPAEICAPLAAAIDAGGIPCGVSEEIDKTLWAKLLYNCTLNPLSAILSTSYGGLIKSGSTIDLMTDIIREIFAVMHAGGHQTFWKDAQAYTTDFFDRILPPTYGHRSSTLQDIERKIPTEIDSLNGAVVQMGRTLGIETPRNTVMTQMIKAIEALYDTRD